MTTEAVAVKITAAAATGATMAWIGDWEGFVVLASAGGLVGHLIWAERSPVEAAALNARGHVAKISRNMVVSGFVGFMVFLGMLHLQLERDPIAYLVTGVLGVFSIDSVIFAFESAKDIIRTFANRAVGGKNDDDRR